MSFLNLLRDDVRDGLARVSPDYRAKHAAWIIAQHVPAKRYLVAVDAEYHAQLSPASVASLVRQGGPMSDAEVAEFGAHPNAEEAVTVRRWDDNAKDPNAPMLPMVEVLAAYDRLHD